MTAVATTPVVSVVVPAHDEEAVIDRCLRRVLDGARPGELDVVVVANGCHDRTAEVARRDGVRVLETAVPGKRHAIGLGDAACRTFPRLYLDADIELDVGSVRSLVTASAGPGVLACAPRPVLDMSHAGPIVRRVHVVHDRLVEPTRALAGVGVYLLTEEGHARAFPIPDVIIADDEWVQRSFAPHERRVVTAAHSVVRPAPTLRAHLRRRARVRAGNDQLRLMGRSPVGNGPSLYALRDLIRSREIGLLDAACYVSVTLCDRSLAVHRRLSKRTVGWDGRAVGTSVEQTR